MAKHPVTMAIRALRAGGVAFEPHLYPWEPRGGTAASSAALGVDEHAVIKTLIMETDARAPLCVLMHGDREAIIRQALEIWMDDLPHDEADLRSRIAEVHSTLPTSETSS